MTRTRIDGGLGDRPAHPGEGLDKPMRLALWDASRGPLIQAGAAYRRQPGGLEHPPAVVAALIGLGLLRDASEGFAGHAAVTPRGRCLANRLRGRRAAIERWERARAAGRRGGRPLKQIDEVTRG